MGCYDCLICEYPLPNPAAQGLLFQTKDLSCLLDKYTLTEQGRLILPCYRTEESRVIRYAEMDQFYHGTLKFYGETLPPLGNVVIFKAYFWEGQLTSIDEVSSSPQWFME